MTSNKKPPKRTYCFREDAEVMEEIRKEAIQRGISVTAVIRERLRKNKKS